MLDVLQGKLLAQELRKVQLQGLEPVGEDLSQPHDVVTATGLTEDPSLNGTKEASQVVLNNSLFTAFVVDSPVSSKLE